MTRLKIALIGILILSLGTGGLKIPVSSLKIPEARASVDASVEELRASSDLIAPKQDLIPSLNGYGNFEWEGVHEIPKGLAIRYRAPFLADSNVRSELPELQVAVLAFDSQSEATSAFEDLVSAVDKTKGLNVLQSEDNRLFYAAEFGGQRADLLHSVNPETRSLHVLERQGNLIFQASLYRESGLLNEANTTAYAQAIAQDELILGLLSGTLEDMESRVNTLFPPSQFIFKASQGSDSLQLSTLRSLPLHGQIDLTVYLNDSPLQEGTVLDSAGLLAAVPGDLYLYLSSEGRLEAGLYAPDYDADCKKQAGWYRLEGLQVLQRDEWNNVSLHYGVGGFSLTVNGVLEASCSVAEARSNREVFLGDFPDDDLAESFAGVIGSVRGVPSLTGSGQEWDTVLRTQLFSDLPDSDVDLPVFEFLKNRGILVGSNGLLEPDRLVNRAEAVKMLVRALHLHTSDLWSVSFPDVPENAWYGRYLAAAVFEGLVKGRDNGLFDPEAAVKGGEVQLILDRAGVKANVGEFGDLDEPLSRRDLAHILYSLML